jgi:superfamily I DNA/RNA helicase
VRIRLKRYLQPLCGAGHTPGREHRPALIWSTGAPPPVRQLRHAGYHVVRYPRFLRSVLAARQTGTVRSSLANPASRLLSVFARHAQVAVLDCVCHTAEDLQLLYGYVVEPALRSGCTLLIHADRELADLAPANFIDPGWRYPWTLERLLYLADIYARQGAIYRQPSVTPALLPPPRPLRLDREQTAAVRATCGVVQVIAPAGSGKTSVLIERVKELLHRGAGTGADRILCSTFNKDARVEIAERLARADVEGVEVRSFHGLGWWILREERRLRRKIGCLSLEQWRWLAHQAMTTEPDGVWIEASAAQNAVSAFKLSAMIPPEAALAAAAAALPDDPQARTLARLYALYEQLLLDRAMNDFDDLIARAVALLQTDSQARHRWQGRFDHVLVDEYQDIEPAQALLVGLLAAPQDSLFCVGDEDQCIYAWRRAAVERVIELDQTYPGLVRYPLVRNYRCGKVITLASRRLIQHNKHRFRKPLHPGAPHRGRIELLPFVDRQSGADWVAAQLEGAERGEIAALARTSTLLREVALACAGLGVPFCAPERARINSGARRLLAACLRTIASWPEPADQQDLALLRRRQSPAAGDFLTFLATLAAEPDAGRVIARLRTECGLDAYFSHKERLNPTERTEVEFLSEAERAAAGSTVQAVVGRFAHDEAVLQQGADESGVELATIHGSKGREWDRVILYGVDEGQTPHARSLVVENTLADAIEAGLEDERRLFYVALTRAKQHLYIVYTRAVPSRFLAEAGLAVK